MTSDARDSSSGVELFRCPTCAAALEVIDAPSVKCKYCGNAVPVPPELRPHKPQVVIQQVDFGSPQVVEATKTGRNIGCIIVAGRVADYDRGDRVWGVRQPVGHHQRAVRAGRGASPKT